MRSCHLAHRQFERNQKRPEGSCSRFQIRKNRLHFQCESNVQSLEVPFNEVVAKLFLLLENQMTAFDLFTEFFENHKIHFEYFSESR